MLKKTFDNSKKLKLFLCGHELILDFVTSWYKDEDYRVLRGVFYKDKDSSIGRSAWRITKKTIDVFNKFQNSCLLQISWDCIEPIDVGMFEYDRSSDSFSLTLFASKPKRKVLVPGRRAKKVIHGEYDSLVLEKPKGAYVYFHCLKGNDKPFYIGKGTGNRYKDRVRNNACNRMWQHNECEVIIFKDNLTSEQALELESDLIQKYSSRGVVLTNVMD